MNRRNVALLCWMMSAVAFGAPGPLSAAPVEVRTPAEAAAAFKPDAPGWAVRDKGYGGSASGNWT